MAAAAPATSAHGAFAFSDLSGFTAFTAERGDDAAIGLVETFRSHMSEGLPPARGSSTGSVMACSCTSPRRRPRSRRSSR